MKSAFLIVLFLINSLPVQLSQLGTADIIDVIANSFRSGDSKELGMHFSTSVSLSILEDNNTYSKNQAEILLHNFFDKYTFRSCKILHKMETNTSNRYAVLELSDASQKFRVSLSLKNFNGKFLITDIRIDKEK
ncbi:hypothetical protein GCM10023231_38770 [Olivibacter ginsenosidimutans]|uniref:DUF4783 domain-containing protein n=1 Tax=Olivibacter ginsenosidimutans TaxID=1176537 RepID=A0ABP9C6Q9_9SPHI